MNKAILSLLLAVCILGMALIMLNDRLRGPGVTPPPADLAAPATVDALPAVVPPASPQAAAPEAVRPAVQPLDADEPPAPLSAPQALPGAAPQATTTQPPAMQTTAQAERQAPAAPRPEPMEQPRPHTAAQTAPKPAPTAKAEAPKPAPATTAEAAKPAPAQQAITRFVIFSRETGATVRLVGNRPLVYKPMQLTGPHRVVVDLDGTWQIKAPGVPKNPLVTNVRIGKMGDRTRVVIDLTAKPQKTRYTLSKDKRTLDIRVDQ